MHYIYYGPFFNLNSKTINFMLINYYNNNYSYNDLCKMKMRFCLFLQRSYIYKLIELSIWNLLQKSDHPYNKMFDIIGIYWCVWSAVFPFNIANINKIINFCLSNCLQRCSWKLLSFLFFIIMKFPVNNLVVLLAVEN